MSDKESHYTLFSRTFFFIFLVSFLVFFFDSYVGGTILLKHATSTFLESTSLESFFLIMLISALFFGVIWIILTLFDFSKQFNKKAIIILLAFTSLFLLILSVILLFLPLNIGVILWNFLYLPLFSFVSYSLYALASIIIAKGVFPDDRGKFIGVSSFISLLLSGLLILIIYHLPFQNFTIFFVLSTVYAVILFASFLIISKKYHFREPDTIVSITKKLPIKITSLKDNNILFLIVAISLFFLGNGIAHSLQLSFLLVTSTELFRAYSFICASFILLGIAFISDKIGRYAIFLFACLFSILSMVLAIYFPSSTISLIFEIASYYSILVFAILEFSDIAPPSKRIVCAGILWSIIYTFNFIGALIGIKVVPILGIIGAIIMSITLLLLAFLIVLTIPNIILKPVNIKAILFTTQSGILIYHQGDLRVREGTPKELIGSLFHAINTFAESIFIEGKLRSIEFSKDHLAVMSQHSDMLIALLVDKHSKQVHHRLNELMNEIQNYEVITLFKNPNLLLDRKLLYETKEILREKVNLYFSEIKTTEEIEV